MSQRVCWVQANGISRVCEKIESLIGQVNDEGEVIDRIVSASATHDLTTTGDWWVSIVVVDTHVDSDAVPKTD